MKKFIEEVKVVRLDERVKKEVCPLLCYDKRILMVAEEYPELFEGDYFRVGCKDYQVHKIVKLSDGSIEYVTYCTEYDPAYLKAVDPYTKKHWWNKGIFSGSGGGSQGFWLKIKKAVR